MEIIHVLHVSVASSKCAFTALPFTPNHLHLQVSQTIVLWLRKQNWNSQILSAPTFIQLLQVDIVSDPLPPGRTLCEGDFTHRIKSWLALHLKSYLCSAFPVHTSCFSCVLSSFPSINHFHPNPLTSEFELWKPNLGCRVKPTSGSHQA